ncbi:MAG: hypothetical protein WBV36_04710 [Terriglobales bacterium]
MLTVNKNEAITKLNRLIEDGRQNAGQVIEHVMSHQPADYIVKANALQFSGNGGLKVALNNAEFGVHRFALGQIAEGANLPVKFLDSLTATDWGRALIAHNLSEIFQHRDAKRHLVRTLNGEVRGFLSDSYRRLDSRPIIEAFVTGVQRLGALPYKGIVSDTKVAIQAILPEVFDAAIPGEVIAFVLSLENSDFGNGALSLRVGALRIWCDNLAIFTEDMRQIHLGRRLDENVVFSQRTYELDTRTTVSALEDIINVQLNREGLKRRMELLSVTAKKAVDPQAAMKLLKDALGVGQAQQVIDAYKSADVEMLPAGNDVWRLSNAISWIGRQEKDGEKRLELMKLAGRVLLPEKGDIIPLAKAEVVEQAA